MHQKRALDGPEASTSAPTTKKAKASKATTSRKAQHSGQSCASTELTRTEIERRRRTKINDCLSILESSVPACRQEASRQRTTNAPGSGGRGSRPARRSSRRSATADDGYEDEATPTDDGNGQAFTPQSGAQTLTLSKLEILECTVEYLRELELRALTAESALQQFRQDTSAPSHLAPPQHLEDGDAAATLLSFASPEVRPAQRDDIPSQGLKI